MYEKITLDMLGENSVSIKTQNFITENGVEYAIGQPHRCAYVNSAHGRDEISLALVEPYLSAVMAIWGDTPTVTEAKASEPLSK